MKSTTQKIKSSILDSLLKLGFKNIDQFTIQLEHPSNESHGDYSSNIAMQLFKKQDKYSSPRDLAGAILLEINNNDKNLNSIISKISVEGPGFINFTLHNDFFINEIKNISKNKINKPTKTNKKIIVEYSSANIAKPFTIGHLRSTIIGDAVANLLESQGNTVYRDNHIGDWGTQFGKQILAIKTWGNEEDIEKSDNPVKELVKLYVKFHEEADEDDSLNDQARAWFKKLEDGDEEARRIWQRCIDWSWKEFDLIYERLNVSFTENNGKGYGESYFEDKMDGVISELKDSKMLTESKGAQLVFFEDDKYPPMMILKNDGATLYSTRDLATDKFRLQHYSDDVQIINEVGSEQELYFRQLFEIEKKLGWMKPGQRIHIKHGLYKFADKKMSTRKGNVIWLEDVLDEAFKRVKLIAKDRINDEEIWKIAVGALKWNDLKRKSELNVTFDWDEITRIDGNSGPYIQYTYARCMSLLAKNEDEKNQDQDTNTLNEEELSIARHLYQFPEVVSRAADELSPHLVTTYLFELTQRFNTFYNKHSILQATENKQFRLELVQAVSITIKNGLGLLGIQVLKKM